MDYGHAVRFGIFPTPSADRVDRLLALTTVAEKSGLDLVTIQDHPYQPAHLDTWTLLSFLGARTQTITLAPNVVNLPLRLPTVLAKAVASLDVLTQGRVELGIGAGAFWTPIEAAGGPRRSPGEAVTALAEAIDILRQCWRGGRVDLDGEHYRVHGYRAGPPPTHPVPIWVGAYKPRMLRLTARLADVWIPSMGYADPPALPALNQAIDEAAQAVDRDPTRIRRAYNIVGRFGTTAGFLEGPAGVWAEQLAELTVAQGMSCYVLGTDEPDVVRRFAAEVAPAVRELVAAHRGGNVSPTADLTAAEPESARANVPGSPRAASATTQARRQGLSVRATPDDGVRRTAPVWQESTRPTRSAHPSSQSAPAQGEFTPEQNATAQHLVDVHDGLRAELAQVRQIMEQVRDGHLDAGAARSAINEMTLRQNDWTLGAYCASYCRILTAHHSLEDAAIFPHLRSRDPGLDAVLDRLEQEHRIIHDVLERLDRALVAVVVADTGTAGPGADDFDRLQHELDVLTDTLLSHLAYEERELIEPLARFGFG
ncbi:MAG: LLM class flavin-dependent oxidoreductase [Actinomycetales bacterium]